MPSATKKPLLALRILFSICIGLIVFLLSVLVAWRNSTGFLMNNDMIDVWSKSSMRTLDATIQRHIESTGSPPPSLRDLAPDLRDETFPNSKTSILKGGVPVDGWGRPIM